MKIPPCLRASVHAVALALLAGVICAAQAHAEIIIPTVPVGNPGNPNDSTGYGGVAYEYRIQTTEVSLDQYTAFLSAVAATDPYSLYNPTMGTNLNVAGISRSGSSGSYTYAVIGSGNRPITYVSWFDAARFANWVANGQPTGAQGNATTEDGAYTLNGAVAGVSVTKNAINPNTGTTTTYWIPTENEWYKAAYYEPSPSGPVDGYWLYPTRSDSAPGNTIGASVNQANYNNGVYSVTQADSLDSSLNYLTDGGAFSNSASYYGTYDQGGNIREWNDTVLAGQFRGLRGGSWVDDATYMESSFVDLSSPTSHNPKWGFRLASVPSAVPEIDPTSLGSVLALVLGSLGLLERRRLKAA